jgi:hypothetical protein
MKYIEVGGSVDAIFAARAASIEPADQDITNSDSKVSAGEDTPTAGSLRGRGGLE